MNRAELRAYVLDRLSISSTDAAKVAQVNGVLGAEHASVVSRLGLLPNRTDVAFTAGVSLVALPVTPARIVNLRRGRSLLRELSAERFAEHEASGVVDDADGPVVYVFQPPSSVRVFPAPETSDPAGAVLWYMSLPAALTDASEPEGIPSAWHTLLAERAIERIALSEEEPGLAGAAGQLAARLESELARHAARRSASPTGRMRLAGYPAR